MQDITKKLEEYQLTGDGTGFWDTYTKEESWLGYCIDVLIAARSVTEEVFSFLNQLFLDQNKWDDVFKKFASKHLVERLKEEWNRPDLTESLICSSLAVSTLSFGFDKDADFCVWFSTPEISSEHGVQVYGNFDGSMIYAGIE